MEHGLKSHSTRLEEPGIELTATGLQGEWFIHYIIVAPTSH